MNLKPHSPLTLIVGPNSSGKTNIFRAVDFVGDALTFDRPQLGYFQHNYAPNPPLFVEISATLSKEEAGVLADTVVAGLLVATQARASHGLDPNEAQRLGREVVGALRPLFLAVFSGVLKFRCVGRDAPSNPLRVEVEVVTSKGSLYLNPISGLSTTGEDLTGFGIVNLGEESLALIAEKFPNAVKEAKERVPLSPEQLIEVVDSMTLDWLMKLLRRRENYPMAVMIDQIDLANFEGQAGKPGQLQLLRAFLTLRGYHETYLNLRGLSCLIFRASIVRLSDARSAPASSPIPRFDLIPTLSSPIAGSEVPTILYRLKNSPDPSERSRFSDIQSAFLALTGERLDVVVEIREDQAKQPPSVRMPWMPHRTAVLRQSEDQGSSPQLLQYASLRVLRESVETPIEYGASGYAELATVLLGLLARFDAIVLLDEPALNLHPTKQKELGSTLASLLGRSHLQVLLVTHSPHFINGSNLKSVIRTVRLDGETAIYGFRKLGRRAPTRLYSIIERDPKLLDALFAGGVVLVEGPAEEAALPVWLKKCAETENPALDLESMNISWISVGGKNSFQPYAKVLDTWSIPYVAIGDADSKPQLMRLRGRGFAYRRGDFSGILEQYCGAELRKAIKEFQPRTHPEKNPAVARRVAVESQPPRPVQEIWDFLKPQLLGSG